MIRSLCETLHVGDVGAIFEFSVTNDDAPVIMTGGADPVFVFMRPDRTTFTRTGEIYDSGNGVIRYTTVSGDLDMDGRWKMQIIFDFPIWQGRSETLMFMVEDNLEYTPSPTLSGFSSGFSSGFGT